MKPYMIIILLATCFHSYTQNYKKIHRKAIVVDTHNDVLSTVTMKGLSIEEDLSGKTHSDLGRFKKGGIDVQVFAIWCDSTFGKDTAFEYANIEIDSLYAIASRNPDKLIIVKTPIELYRAIKNKKLAAMIGIEGGHMIENNISYLDILYKRGARYLTLTWNNSTSWATSSLDESTNHIINEKKGLNVFGKSVVKRMNELGMMIDVSHVGEQTFEDVINSTTKPIIASHSSVYSLEPHHRNLKDEQIKAIARNGGVIQLNLGFLDSTFRTRLLAFFAAHRSETDSLRKSKKGLALISYMKQKYPEEINALRPSLSMLLDHIDYIKNLVGIDYVGIGSDFDGIPITPYNLEDVAQFPNITKGLVQRGYSKRDIKKVLGGNFIRVFKANRMASGL
jgi:membrane dipeptidase